MALVDSQEVQLAISAETLGGSDVTALANQVEALAAAGGDAAPEFARLADELRKLDQQQVRVNGLQEAIGSAKQAWTAFSSARDQAALLDRQLADARGAGANRDAIRLLDAELRRANQAVAAHEKAWTRQSAALKTARTEAAAAGVDTRNLGTAQEQLAAGLERARSAVASQVESVNRASQAEAERARAARQQADEEQRLAAIVAASKKRLEQAAQEQLQAEKRAYAEAEAAAKRYAEVNRSIASGIQNAFSAIGIRSSATIKAEILAIQQGLQRLAADAKVSGAEFDRAWAAGQKRIAELRAEMSGGVDPFTSSVGRATGAVGSLLTKLGPLGIAIAAAFSSDKIAQTAVAFDSLNRTLKAIKGDQAAAELGYIVAASNRLGLELGSSSKAYAQFLTVTHGTALEGQKSRDIFEAVAGSMARLGKSAADTDGAMLALSQMVSKGVVSMEELRQQLAERFPGALKAAADGAGLTEAELIKMVETGQVLAEDLLPAMAAQLDKLYGTQGEAEGYASSWNKFTNAITHSIGAFTQTGVVVTTVTGTLAVLRETVLIIGTAFVGAAEGVTLFGRGIGTVAAAIATGNWSGLGAELGKLAKESKKRINEIADQTILLKGAQESAGDAAAAAGQKAAASAGGWLQITNAYAQVNAAADAYVKQSEKALAARKAEAEAATQFAQLAGTEVQVREAEAQAAINVAAATAQVAQAKAAQLAAQESELAAKQQVAAADEKESANKAKLIEEIRKKIELSKQETAEATAAAQSAQLEAASRQAIAQTVRDHSTNLDALRAAYLSAAESVKFLEEMERAGVAASDETNAARARAIQANVLYRDAISDNIRAIEAQSREQQAAMSIEQRVAQLKLTAIQGAEKAARIAMQGSENSARAYEYEVRAAWKLIEAKRQEARIAELRARAQRAEAEAQLAKVKAQEAELTETDRLDKAKMAELEAAKAAATAKQIEGQISAELAKQLDAEASAAIRAMNAKRGVGQAGQEAGEGAAAGAEGINVFVGAASEAVDVGTVFADIWNEARKRIADVSAAADAAVAKLSGSAKNWHEFITGLQGIGAAANNLVAEDELGSVASEIAELDAQIADINTRLQAFNDPANRISMPLDFRGWWESIGAMQQLQANLLEAKKRHAEFRGEVEQFNRRVEEGSGSLRDQERLLRGLVARAEQLGSQELSGLRNALRSVRQELRSMTGEADSAIDSMNDRLDEAAGRFVEIEKRKAATQRSEYEAKRAAAQAAGNADAARSWDVALSKLREVERIELEKARAREAEAVTERNAKRTPAPSASDQAAASARSTQVHRVEISLGGRTRTIATDAAGASTLSSIFRELEAAAGVAQ